MARCWSDRLVGCPASGECHTVRWTTAALWPAALGIGQPCAPRRVLARARQCLLGRHLGGDRLSAASWRFAAQGVVPHDRHGGGRRGDRGADRVLSRRLACAFLGDPGAVGQYRRSPRHACCATSPLMRRRSAGYTAAIIAADTLGATGGANTDVFMLAVNRASEICIGIVCAGIVLAGTDLGGAQRRLAALFAAPVSRNRGPICRHLGAGRAGLAGDAAHPTRARPASHCARSGDRRGDGESSQLRYHSPVLQRAVDGMFAALAGWRMVAAHLARLPHDTRSGGGRGRPAQRAAGAALGAGAR